MIKKLFKKRSIYQLNRVNITHSVSAKRCAGKVALVIGASSGIGKACAINLAQNGAQVVLAARRENLLKEAVQEINSLFPNSAEYVICDARNIDDIKNAVDFSIKKFGKIDIAVNNFGSVSSESLLEITEEKFYEQINLNIKGTLFAMKYEIAAMLKFENQCSIINLGSTLSFEAAPGGKIALYCLSKHAVAGMTKAVAAEGHKNIRVNAICPGSVRSRGDGSFTSLRDEYGEVKRKYPIGRVGEPQEIASFITFLASDEASFVNGAIIPVDGGYLTF